MVPVHNPTMMTILIVAVFAGFLLAGLFGDSKPGQDNGDLMFPEAK
jgi:hypothetical protein